MLMERDKYGNNKQQKESDRHSNTVWVRLEISYNCHSKSASMSYLVLLTISTMLPCNSCTL
jgi:hypothetical protein